MDPRFVPDRAEAGRDRDGEPALPSRLDAMAECRSALRRLRGPVLLTGEAGSGKTWTWRRLAAEEPDLGPAAAAGAAPARWIGLDAAPSDDGLDLVRRALRALGRLDAGTVPDPRSALLDELLEQTEDGRRWVLVLDEAQNASDAALEEFRLLSNRLGRPDGFDGLLLVGRTGLVFRLRGRAWESLESRLSSTVRLGPIDAEEAASLVCWSAPERSWDRSTVEDLHARSMGNPNRLIRLADRLSSRPEPSPSRISIPSSRVSASRRPPAEGLGGVAGARGVELGAGTGAGTKEDSATSRSGCEPTASEEAARPTPTDRPRPEPRPGVRIEAASSTPPAPRLVEARPPLRFEDGLIEVGWDELQADTESAAESEDRANVWVDAGGEAESDADDDAESWAEPSAPDFEEHALRFGVEPFDRLDAADSSSSLPADHQEIAPRGPITEVIDDPYAAIQSRSEREVALEAVGGLTDGLANEAEAEDREPTEDRGAFSTIEEDDESARRPSQVRAEGGQDFAPYSRLFSQLNSASDAE